MKKFPSSHLNSNSFSLIYLAILASLALGSPSNAAVGVTDYELPSDSNDQTFTATLFGNPLAGTGDRADRYGWIAKTGWVWTGNFGNYSHINDFNNLVENFGSGESGYGVNGTPTLISGLLANASTTLSGNVQFNVTQYVDLPSSIFYGVLGYTDGYINDSYDSNENSPSGHINNQTFTIGGSLTINVDDGATLSSLYGISTGHPGTETNLVNTLNIGGDVLINYTTTSDMATVATNIIGAEVLQGGKITAGSVQINLIDTAPTGYVYGAAVTSDATTNASLTLTNGVTVNVTGTWDSSGLSDGFTPSTIYGAVNGSSNSSAFKVGANATNYRTLNFGTSADDTFTSKSEDSNKVFSFSNFDNVTVGSGSTLVLTVNNQTPYLYGDISVFGSTTVSADSSLLNGITSYAGRLLVRDATIYKGSSSTNVTSTLTINSGSTGNLIMELENSGNVVVDGDLTLTDTAITIGGTTYSGYNAGTISGSGTLTFSSYVPYSLTSSDSSYSSSISTSSGTFTNQSGGTISVDTINVAGASVLNNGTIGTGTQTLTISNDTSGNTGSLTDSGQNATINVKTLTVNSGSLTNQNNAKVKVADTFTLNNGSVINDATGTVSISTLTVNGGTFTNEGDSSNDGYVSASEFNLVGDATVNNSGIFRVLATNNSGSYTGGATTMTAGTLNNSNVFTSYTFDLSGDNSLVKNTNTVAITTLNMTGGEIDNTSSSSTTAMLGTGKVNISDATIENTGTIVSLDFTMGDNALVDISEGSFYVIDLSSYTLGGETIEVSPTGATLNGGVMIVGNGSSSAETAATAEFLPLGNIETKIYVNGGKLGLGEVEPTTVTGSLTTTIANLYDALAEAQEVENNFNVSDLPTNLLALTTRVTTGDNGYIGVGESYTSRATSTGLYFSGNSTLILTLESDGTYVAGSDSSSSAFTTTSGTSLTVDDGATLLVQGTYDKMPARFYITSGYSYDENELWKDGSTIKVVDQYGLSYDYLIHAEDEGGTPVVYLGYYAQTEEDSDPTITPSNDFFDLGYVAGNIIMSDIQNWRNPDAGAQAVIDIVGAQSLTLGERVKIMNSIANLPFAGGVIGTAMSDLNGAITDLNNHLTMDSDTFGAHGVMWPYEEANNLWLDVDGTWYNQKHLKASRIDRAGWRASAFGFILGYDRKIKDAPVAMGAAFSFTGGNVKSTGNISYTKNKYQDYGVHLYTNYSPNEHLNVIGALHWMHNVSDVTQKVGVTATGGNYLAKAHGHMNTDWLALGVRFETSFSAGAFTFVPHIEPRYVYAKMRNFDTQIDGATIWNTHARGNNFFQVPLGIAARADFLTASGWTIRPNADVTIIPQVGSTKLKTELRNSYNAADAAEGEFMGKFQTAVKIGVQFDRKNWTLGAKYGLVAGDRGRIDHGFILQGRLRF